MSILLSVQALAELSQHDFLRVSLPRKMIAENRMRNDFCWLYTCAFLESRPLGTVSALLEVDSEFLNCLWFQRIHYNSMVSMLELKPERLFLC